MRARGALPALLLVAAACDAIPADPGGTLERVRGGVMLVGVTDSPPWIIRPEPGPGGEPTGPEADLVRGFARAIDARVRWEWAPLDENLERLERRELDLVAAGLTRDSPWARRVPFTRPYARWRAEERALAVPPGENAFLVALERWLRTHPAPVPAGSP